MILLIFILAGALIIESVILYKKTRGNPISQDQEVWVTHAKEVLNSASSSIIKTCRSAIVDAYRESEKNDPNKVVAETIRKDLLEIQHLIESDTELCLWFSKLIVELTES